MTDIVERLRMYAEDLQTPDPNHHRHEPYSAGGFNGYASAMSLAADEIVKLREYAETIEADLVATIDQRDELGAVLDAARARAWKDRNTRCGCDHNESCAECFPPAFHTGGYWDQQRASLQQTTSLSTKESDDAND